MSGGGRSPERSGVDGVDGLSCPRNGPLRIEILLALAWKTLHLDPVPPFPELIEVAMVDPDAVSASSRRLETGTRLPAAWRAGGSG